MTAQIKLDFLALETWRQRDFKVRRNQLGMSLREVEIITGIPKSRLFRIERGASENVTLSELVRISLALRHDPFTVLEPLINDIMGEMNKYNAYVEEMKKQREVDEWIETNFPPTT